MNIDMLTLSTMLGAGLITVELLMLVLWVIYVFSGRIGLIDIGFGLSFIITASLCFILGNGFLWRKFLVMLLVSVWALRLTFYMIERYKRSEDPRYSRLIYSPQTRLFGNIRSPRFKVLLYYLAQGLITVLLSLPFALMSDNSFSYFNPSEVFGLLIWVVGIAGETVADRQLSSFKQIPGNEHEVCETGLWYYSRHPNYFFEWVVWIGYFVMAYSSPGGVVAIISPLLMLYLLVRVSGIPSAEEEALLTKGDAYREYQARTSAFIPWFKKR